ncbi:hypothetical protein ACBJ59_60680 [Nonomuraea sp. MTCD27]|uniref:hypothetical protein n=1 Tax=Nonomuraea sp. MTCD27 TaxID=1676747 RepID=UPI0035C24A7D
MKDTPVSHWGAGRGTPWHAEVDRGKSAGLVSLLAKEGESEVDAFDLTEPALGFGSGSASHKVDFNFIESGQHRRVNIDHWASRAGMLMLARGCIGTGASSEFDFAPVEVPFQIEPLLFADRAIFVWWPGLAAAVEEPLIVANDVFDKYNHVAASCLKVQMSK